MKKSLFNWKNLTIICAIIGLIDSIYLSWIKLSNTAALCLPGIGDCETVNTSRYSEIFGVPIALLGVAGYLAIIGLVLIESRSQFFLSNGPLLLFGISLVGVLYSAYLTYIEIAVIYAVCPYCVISAVMMLGIFVCSCVRLFNLEGSH